jgi:uncharacterized membrane protein (UPF0127 family)
MDEAMKAVVLNLDIPSIPGLRIRPGGRPALLLTLAVMAVISCGGAAGEDGDSGREGAQSADASGVATDQEATDGPRFGPGGQLIRQVDVSVGGIPISVEIADTPALRERGLMHRDSLPANHGMLFVYADEQMRSFWMRNTKIPLDIAFIDRNGTIVNIEQMEAQTDENTVSNAPAMYALEMSLGWFEANGVGIGDRLEF